MIEFEYKFINFNIDFREEAHQKINTLGDTSLLSYFYVESSHIEENCLLMLEEILQYNPRLLNSLWFGCESGDHTSRAILEGRNENEVREFFPINQRDKILILKVEKYSPEEIRALQIHQSSKSEK